MVGLSVGEFDSTVGAGANVGTLIVENAVGTGVGLLIVVLIMVVFGAIVGWLAGLLVKGSG